MDERWRIRQSSVQLLGSLLFRIVGASGKADIAGNDDEGISTEAQNATIIRTLGKSRRDSVLASLFIMRSDMHQAVKTESLHVWKSVVVNTPHTLMDILPHLTTQLIKCLASSDVERRQVAGQALGDVVRRLNDRVLPTLLKILQQTLDTGDTVTRQGACLGLSELMRASSRAQVLQYLDSLLPAVRQALCDSEEEVREAAAESFNELHHGVGARVIDDIMPNLIGSLASEDTYPSAVHGLSQILKHRANAVFPYLLQKLLKSPISEFNARGFGEVAKSSEPPLSKYLDRILPTLYDEHHNAAVAGQAGRAATMEQAACDVVCAVSTDGFHFLLQELNGGLVSDDAHVRRLTVRMFQALCQNGACEWQQHTATIISSLVVMTADSDREVLLAVAKALDVIAKTIPKENMAVFITTVRDALGVARNKVSKRNGDEATVPGLEVPGGLSGILPFFVNGFMLSGNTETRQSAALAMGEIVSMTQATALQSHFAAMTGPLIRIFGERCPWQVKAAILQSLALLLQKGSQALKAFTPQLLSTFTKGLKDSTMVVRDRAITCLEKLVTMGPKLEALVNELLADISQNPDDGVKVSMLTALLRTMSLVGSKMTAQLITTVIMDLNGMVDRMPNDQAEIAAQVIGVGCASLTDKSEVLRILSEVVLKGNSGWESRVIRANALSGFVSVAPVDLLVDLSNAVMPALVAEITDDKVQVKQIGVQTLGAFVNRLSASNKLSESSIGSAVGLLPQALQSDSADVKCATLRTIKRIAKSSPSVTLSRLSTLVPVVLDMAKDRHVGVKLVAERCLIHLLQMSNGKSDVLSKYLQSCDAETAKTLSEYAKRVLGRLVSDGQESDPDE
eukprot:c6397_g1_i1.p1 GENE.c6397_g1_i1~~c6397_g1_i1.p1  ORF type:complete len:852 (+),score=258.65 c6397_g1_i1:525-3080(+)